MDNKLQIQESSNKKLNVSKEKTPLKAKQDIFVSVRNKNFFGCIKDVPIEDIEITDTEIVFKMGTTNRTIDVEDLISVSSTPQCLQDQNCLSVFYKEYTNANKTKFKIAELKLACARSVSKLIMIEKLRLNVKNKFNFDYLKSNAEVAADEYFKGLINKPKQVYQGIKIIQFVFYYKNGTILFSLLRKKYGKEKSVSEVDVDKIIDKQPEMNFNDNYHKFAPSKIENEIDNKFFNNLKNFEYNSFSNKNTFNVLLKDNIKGINDSNNLFKNQNIEKDSPNNCLNNSRIKIYEKKDSKEGFDSFLMHDDINLNIDSENDIKKIILKNRKEIEEQIIVQETNNNGKLSNINARNSIDDDKDKIAFKRGDMDPNSINEYDTFNIKEINQKENNIIISLEGMSQSNPIINLDKRLSIEKKDSFSKSIK